MAKKTLVKCVCSRCGQVANAQAGNTHIYCKGIHKDILALFPAHLQNLTNPSKKGVWKQLVSPNEKEVFASLFFWNK